MNYKLKPTKKRMILLFLLFCFLEKSFAQNASTDTTMRISEKEKKVILESRSRNVNLGNSTTTELKCQVINTNFTIPLIRFNTTTKDGADNNQKGNVALFNSVGAGISYNWGRMTVTTDAAGKVINTEFQNTFGFS